MKVLFVHKSALGADGEAAMHYYPATLAQLGHEVMMAAPAGGNCDFFSDTGVKVREVASDEPWLATIRNIVAEERPDIVHVYLYSGCGLLPFYVRSASPESRFVMDIRSPLLRRGLFRLLHRLKNLFEPLFFDAIASHGIESAWTQIGRREGICWLPPGVDFSSIPPRSAVQERENGPCRLVYIGSLDAIRQVDLMLAAFIKARESSDITLDIYGDGEMKTALEKTVSDQRLDEHVTFKGRVDRNIVLAALPSYDAGLAYIPGGIYDTAPALKTLEYLACGLPVVATNTFGNRMFVKEGVNGLLAGNGIDAYARGLSEISGCGKLEAMRRTARASVESFDWQKMTAERLLPLYKSLLGTHA